MYDLVITGGRVIDPAQALDAPRDVAFQDGKVAAVQARIEPGAAREVIQAAGKLVVPGLIDLHTHVYWGGTSLTQAEGAFDYVDVMGERLAGERRLEVEAMVLHGRAWPHSDAAG
jgi:imidazolonepropionase-like amidohydrolase